jgi:hypothetical protein
MSDKTLAQIQKPDGSPVPHAWTAALTHLHGAQVARDGMRNPEASGPMRDEATIRFGRELEALFDAMAELKASGATGVITAILCKRGR